MNLPTGATIIVLAILQFLLSALAGRLLQK
jgi:hypothetical protein